MSPPLCRKTVSVVLGTRPEAIKLAPVVFRLRERSDLRCRICLTAQHREMLDQILKDFGLKAEADLNLMRPNQRLPDLLARAVRALYDYFLEERPALVLIQGDTTTVLAAALAAFYARVPVGHVEAGLRTGDLNAPWPEEANRVLSARLCALHFAPTVSARENLLAEGIPASRIFVTGNTVVDAVLMAEERVRRRPPAIASLPPPLQPGAPASSPPVVMITSHRRENWGPGLENICRTVRALSVEFPDVHFVYPVHLNPNVREPVFSLLSKLPNVHLIDPLPYFPFIALMMRSCLILTDSGGIQEEAPSLGKPVLVMREKTERAEGLRRGFIELVGTDSEKIARAVRRHLRRGSKKTRPAKLRKNPYGDGSAALRIASIVAQWLNLSEARA